MLQKLRLKAQKCNSKLKKMGKNKKLSKSNLKINWLMSLIKPKSFNRFQRIKKLSKQRRRLRRS